MRTTTDPYEGTMHLWASPGLSTITLRRKPLQAFLEATGGNIMARGHLWDITTKHLGAGVYQVSTEPHHTPQRTNQ